MARPYWSGQIQISLVSFGVKLMVATEAASDLHFHQIDRKTGERVKHQKVLSSAMEAAPDAAATPVDRGQIVKGYEYSKGRYVTLEPEELAHLRVASKHTMDVTQFVDAEELGPEYFEKPYFVVPENEAQTEAFLTVRQALVETKKIGLSKIAFAGREHVVALAPAGRGANGEFASHGGMMAYTLRYAAELRSAEDAFRDVKTMRISDDSLDLAKELIRRRSAKFDAGRFVDGYEAAVKELVEAKLKHVEMPKDEATVRPRGKGIDLMEALRRSVAGDERKEPAKKGPVLVKSAARSSGKKATQAAKGAAKTAGARRKSA